MAWMNSESCFRRLVFKAIPGVEQVNWNYYCSCLLDPSWHSLDTPYVNDFHIVQIIFKDLLKMFPVLSPASSPVVSGASDFVWSESWSVSKNLSGGLNWPLWTLADWTLQTKQRWQAEDCCCRHPHCGRVSLSCVYVSQSVALFTALPTFGLIMLTQLIRPNKRMEMDRVKL